MQLTRGLPTYELFLSQPYVDDTEPGVAQDSCFKVLRLDTSVEHNSRLHWNAVPSGSRLTLRLDSTSCATKNNPCPIQKIQVVRRTPRNKLGVSRVTSKFCFLSYAYTGRGPETSNEESPRPRGACLKLRI